MNKKGFYKVKKGNYKGKVYIDKEVTTEDGLKIQIRTSPRFDSFGEAEIAFNDLLKEKIKEKRAHTNVSFDKLTLEELCNQYVDHMRTGGRSSNTIINTKSKLGIICKEFGKEKMSGFCSNVNNLKGIKALVTSDNMKVVTKNSYLSLILRVFDFARKLEIITNSDYAKAEVYFEQVHDRDNDSSNDKRIKYFTEDEWIKFISCIDKNSPYYVLFNVAYYSGMRVGELTGLTWDVINYENNTITINKQCSNSEDGRGITNSLKTKSSYRVISMPKEVMNLLKDLQDHSHGRVVFFNSQAVSSAQINRMIDKYFELSGNKNHYSIHCFRHSHASFLINNGVDVLFISKRLGHQNVSMTLDTYSHLFPKAEEKGMDKITAFCSKQFASA